ncbi:hypothetical protein [Streptomyces sp. NPDC050535]|uniref:hypothetical protein n=1 Tax=Streptomyces sp. NPDC050535 TaxID=3365626 RepID=UPI0037B48B9D
MNPEYYLVVPGHRAGDRNEFIAATPDGIRLKRRDGFPRPLSALGLVITLPRLMGLPGCPPDLAQAIMIRSAVYGRRTGATRSPLPPADQDASIDHIAAGVLMVPRSDRWREAVSTALAGHWCDPLWQSGQLPFTALGALKAEACTVHRRLVPLWRRRTRHGRVLSLDADLGDGLSLYDLVTTEVDYLAHTSDGVYEDERLNRVLRGLDPLEQQIVFAYAAGEGTTWTEAAAGAADPEALGERVRRKTRRLAAEQRRRAVQRDSRSDF